MAGSLDTLEAKLNEMLVTKAPFQLPDNFRKWLAKYSWVFALIGLIFGIFSVLGLFAVLGLASAFAVGAAVEGVGAQLFFAWVSLLVLVGYVVLLGVATPKLKRMEKSGWNLIFYSSLFFMVYNVFNTLRYADLGFGALFSLVWNLAISFVGLYFIFQIRSYFTGKVAKPAAKK
jgi:hypothetical protein